MNLAARRTLLSSNAFLAYLCLAGLLVRLPFIGYGIPGQWEPDEWVCVTTGFKFFHGNFVNNGSIYPALLSILIFLGDCIYFLIGYSIGHFHNFKDFFSSFYMYGDPYLDHGNPAFFIIARLASATTYVISAFLVGIFLKNKFSLKISTLTTVLWLLLPWEFINSRYGVPESLLVSTTVLALIAIEHFFDRPSMKQWIIASSTAVIAGSAKQTGILLAIPLAISLLILIWQGVISKKKAWQFFLIAFFLIPISYALLNPGMVFSKEANMVSALLIIWHFLNTTKAAGSEIYCDPWWSIFSYIKNDLGYPLVVLCLLGMGSTIYLRKFRGIIPMSFIFVYYALFQLLDLKIDRYVLLITSYMLIWWFPEALTVIEWTNKKWAIILLSALAALHPIIVINKYYKTWAVGDTRIQADKWLEKQDLNYSAIAREIHFTPQVPLKFKGKIIETYVISQTSLADLKLKGVGLIFVGNSNHTKFDSSLPCLASFHGQRIYGCYNPDVYIFAL